MGSPAQEAIQALSTWHFVLTLGVWLAFAAALYNAAIGLLGINAVKPNATKWPTWVWYSFAAGLVLAVGGGWQAASEMRDADLQKRTAKAQYDAVTKKLDGISSQNAEMGKQFDLLRQAGQISGEKTPAEVVQEIIGKLPKPEVGAVVNGHHNSVGQSNNQLGGQTAGTMNNNYYGSQYSPHPSSIAEILAVPANQDLLSLKLHAIGDYKFLVNSIGHDSDSYAVAQLLHNICLRSGWIQITAAPPMNFTPGISGIELSGRTASHYPALVQKFREAFASIGIKLSTDPAANSFARDDDVIEFMVGEMPAGSATIVSPSSSSMSVPDNSGIATQNQTGNNTIDRSAAHP
jgi:hypothetical protein